MAPDGPVHAPETADGATARAAVAPVALGAAADGTTGAWDSPPAKPTNLRASGAHDEVTLTWSAATDQTVTHHAVLRRNRDPDAVGLFHVTDTG